MRQDKIAICELLDDRANRSPENLRSSNAPVTEGNLISCLVVRMASDQDRRILPPLADRLNEGSDFVVVLRQAVGNKRRVNLTRIDFDDDVSRGQPSLDLPCSVGLCGKRLDFPDNTAECPRCAHLPFSSRGRVDYSQLFVGQICKDAASRHQLLPQALQISPSISPLTSSSDSIALS